MGFWDRLTGEFVDVIAWTDDSDDTMVWRFERFDNAIKYGAKLTVREGQSAVFVNQGRLADVFPPGMYMLETNNLPILSSLQHWDHGFQSPFKVEVYFVNTRRFTDLKWGTKNPIMLRDPEFGPVRLRAFGTYVIKVADPAVFLREVVGTDGHFTTDEVTNQLRNMIVSRFGNSIANAGVPVLDLAANYDQLGTFITERIKPEVAEYGLDLIQLLVENVSLPPEVEKALDKRTSIGIVGDLSKYTQYAAAEAMGNAAEQPGGGGMASGMGMGAGIAMGQVLAQSMGAAGTSAPATSTAAPTPPPVPTLSYWVAINGQQQGPYSRDKLAEQITAGAVTRDSLVWAQGMAGWSKAADVADLSALFGAMPPPLPGA